MARGGYRKNAGRKKKWNHGETRSIRVPIALADEILEVAHKIDEGIKIESETKSNIIDLSGIPIIMVNGKQGVSLYDLFTAGYEIYPLQLAENLRKTYLNGVSKR